MHVTDHSTVWVSLGDRDRRVSVTAKVDRDDLLGRPKPSRFPASVRRPPERGLAGSPGAGGQGTC
jgi:hypothetical protein